MKRNCVSCRYNDQSVRSIEPCVSCLEQHTPDDSFPNFERLISKAAEKCYGCMGATFLDCEICDERKGDQK